ncbi:MAG: coproporphyrinogen dehydrogenase HemZ, partial [Eubacteriales bacterium]
EETLQIIGRHNTIEQVKEVFYLAREVGFTNINMDLILGLPEETVEDVANTMKEIMVLQPDSITMHSLAIKRAARLSAWVEEHGTDSIRNSIEAMGLVQEASKQMQMQPYYLYRQKNMAGNFENIGYARSGAYGIYNIIIMEEKQNIMAVGAGSISKVIAKDGSMKRCDCVKDVEMYIDQIDEMIERKRRLLQWE